MDLDLSTFKHKHIYDIRFSETAAGLDDLIITDTNLGTTGTCNTEPPTINCTLEYNCDNNTNITNFPQYSWI